jgi:hypothetical protein
MLDIEIFGLDFKGFSLVFEKFLKSALINKEKKLSDELCVITLIKILN